MKTYIGIFLVCAFIGALTVTTVKEVSKNRKIKKKREELKVKVTAIQIDPETGWVS